MDYVQLLQMLGLPILFYAGVLWLMWKTSDWLMVEVVRPWNQRHLAFVERLERSTLEQVIVLSAILKAQEEHVRCLAEIIQTLKLLQEQLTSIQEKK